MEVPDQVGEDKFKVNDDYDFDKCRIAQWLRVIDGLNNENPVPVPEGSLFARLQEKAKLSIFTEEFLVSEAMNMSDRLYEMYVEKKHARAEGRAEGHADVLNVLKDMGLTPEQIAEAKTRLATMDAPPAK
ncbi:MAG: hypothetical protein II819_04590 [Fibrobacter sp.]|nr:hypothetical protein [Fibrobacter sp.]